MNKHKLAKIRVNLTIDNELYTRLKLRNENISKIVEDYLKSYLDINQSEAMEDYNTEIIKLEAELNKFKMKQKVVDADKEKKKKEQEEFDKLPKWEKLNRGFPVKIK